MKAADCRIGKVSRVKKKSRKKRKRVIKQGAAPGSLLPDAATIDLTIAKKNSPARPTRSL